MSLRFGQEVQALPRADAIDTEALHVVAAVLRDAQGRVLLARCSVGRAHAGLWEFPGGKVEAGESALEALRRELREELGIEVRNAEALIRVPVAAAGGTSAVAALGAAPVTPLGPIRLRLDTWEVRAFDGVPRAHEHSALAWVAAADLAHYPMPPADRPVAAALRGPAQLLVTPEPGEGPAAEAAFIAHIEAALAAGLRRIHLRLSDARADARRRLAAALAGPCRAVNAALFVHGDARLARELDLGLHWRAGQLHASEAAALSRAHREAGLAQSAACHAAADLARADALGIDDLLLGPVKATATHPGAAGLGWAGFEALRAQTTRPVWALGGLGPHDLAEARCHGAQGVAGIRAFWPLTASPEGLAQA